MAEIDSETRQPDRDAMTISDAAPAQGSGGAPARYGETIADVGAGSGGSWAPSDSSEASAYKVHRELGSGAMGRVLLARHEKINKWVAIKRPLHGSDSSERAFQRFLIEARAVANLAHAHIVHVYDFGEDEQGPFIVMEYVGGPGEDAGEGMPAPPLTLQDKIVRDGVMSVDEARRLGVKLCSALAKAHSNGVVHRDIKPANVLIDADGEPKLADFGLASLDASGGRPQMTEVGSAFGTPGYSAPEQRIDASKADARSDLYALAATIWFVLTGDDGNSFRESDVPLALRRALSSAMARDREERPESADALKKLLVGGAGPAAAPTASGDWVCPDPDCNRTNNRDARFCKGCSWDSQIQCPHCGAEASRLESFCGECGASPTRFSVVEALIEDAEACLQLALCSKAGELLQLIGVEPVHMSQKLRVAQLDERANQALAARQHALDAVQSFAKKLQGEFLTPHAATIAEGARKDLDRLREARAKVLLPPKGADRGELDPWEREIQKENYSKFKDSFARRDLSHKADYEFYKQSSRTISEVYGVLRARAGDECDQQRSNAVLWACLHEVVVGSAPIEPRLTELVAEFEGDVQRARNCVLVAIRAGQVVVRMNAESVAGDRDPEQLAQLDLRSTDAGARESEQVQAMGWKPDHVLESIDAPGRYNEFSQTLREVDRVWGPAIELLADWRSLPDRWALLATWASAGLKRGDGASVRGRTKLGLGADVLMLIRGEIDRAVDVSKNQTPRKCLGSLALLYRIVPANAEIRDRLVRGMSDARATLRSTTHVLDEQRRVYHAMRSPELVRDDLTLARASLLATLLPLMLLAVVPVVLAAGFVAPYLSWDPGEEDGIFAKVFVGLVSGAIGIVIGSAFASASHGSALEFLRKLDAHTSTLGRLNRSVPGAFAYALCIMVVSVLFAQSSGFWWPLGIMVLSVVAIGVIEGVLQEKLRDGIDALSRFLGVQIACVGLIFASLIAMGGGGKEGSGVDFAWSAAVSAAVVCLVIVFGTESLRWFRMWTTRSELRPLTRYLF